MCRKNELKEERCAHASEMEPRHGGRKELVIRQGWWKILLEEGHSLLPENTTVCQLSIDDSRVSL